MSGQTRYVVRYQEKNGGLCLLDTETDMVAPFGPGALEVFGETEEEFLAHAERNGFGTYHYEPAAAWGPFRTTEKKESAPMDAETPRYTTRRLADGDLVVIDAETGLITGYFGDVLAAQGHDEAWAIEDAQSRQGVVWQSPEGLVFEGEEAMSVDERYVLRDTTDGDFAVYDVERKLAAPFYDDQDRDLALVEVKADPSRFHWAGAAAMAAAGVAFVEPEVAE